MYEQKDAPLNFTIGSARYGPKPSLTPSKGGKQAITSRKFGFQAFPFVWQLT